jgi:HK97 family phage major capsid protein
MAITAATKTSDFAGFLTPAQSAPIFAKARRASIVQQLVQKVPLGASGVAVPVVTGKLAAAWVAEGAQKPASSGSMTLKTISPKKLACIAVVSAEVVRANPGGYMDEIQLQVGEAFAASFDSAALHGTSTPFGTFIDQSTNSVELVDAAGVGNNTLTQVYTDINSGLRLLVTAGKRLTGFAFDNRFEPELNDAKDTAGRPLFVDAPITDEAGPIRLGRMLGRPVTMGEGVWDATVKSFAYGGDFTQAAWGVVGGISYDISTEAAVTINGALTSLWENNLVAVRAEAEYGWIVNDVQSFVKYVNATDS